MAATGAPAARCQTVLLTLAVLLGIPGQALGLQGAGAAAVNFPSCEELTSSLMVNQLATLKLMQDASDAGSCMAEREARRLEEAAERDARLQEMEKAMENLVDMVENATQETVKGVAAQHAALQQKVTNEVAALREEMAAQGRLIDSVCTLQACPDGWLCHGFSCYLFDDTDRNWEDSLAYCRSLGGDLAKITSAEEHEFIKGKLQNNYYWIGLNDKAREGHFVWADGSALTYTRWQRGEPNNCCGGQHCGILQINYGYNWDDAGCSVTASAVCERPVHA